MGSKAKIVTSWNFKSGINALSWNLTSSCLASGTAVGEITVVASEQVSSITNEVGLKNKFKHAQYNAVKRLKFSPFSENILFSTSSDGSVNLWDINKSAASQPLHQYSLHSKACTGVVFSKNSDKIVCSIGYDSKLIFYDFVGNK